MPRDLVASKDLKKDKSLKGERFKSGRKRIFSDDQKIIKHIKR